MELNYNIRHYIRAYNTLFSRTGKDEGIDIDRSDYMNGYALYAFDLTADLGDEESFNLSRLENVRFVLKPKRHLRLWSMNTQQIDSIVRRYVRRFHGVFSADCLPDNSRLLVCNTDPAHRPGEHWVVMYVDDEGRFGEYFDSLGRPPPVAFRRYLDRHCRYWSYNNRQ